jgi:hypothetical protein
MNARSLASVLFMGVLLQLASEQEEAVVVVGIWEVGAVGSESGDGVGQVVAEGNTDDKLQFSQSTPPKHGATRDFFGILLHSEIVTSPELFPLPIWRSLNSSHGFSGSLTV